jgi:hypothetical protein
MMTSQIQSTWATLGAQRQREAVCYCIGREAFSRPRLFLYASQVPAPEMTPPDRRVVPVPHFRGFFRRTTRFFRDRWVKLTRPGGIVIQQNCALS